MNRRTTLLGPLVLLAVLASSAAARPAEDVDELCPGIWSGGYGSLDPEDSVWRLTTLSVTAVDGDRFEGMLYAPIKVELEGRIGDDELAFDVHIGSRLASFRGEVENGVLKGEVMDDAGLHKLLLVLDGPGLEPTPSEFTGVYEVEPGHRICVYGSRTLAYEDLDSGDVRIMYRTGRDSFVTGASIARPRPVESQIVFGRSETGEVESLQLLTAWGEVFRAKRLPPITTEGFEFLSDDDTLHGSLFLPPDPGPHPAII